MTPLLWTSRSAKDASGKSALTGRWLARGSWPHDDPQIWGELDADPSVYLHRIATHPDFRGRKMVGHVVQWARPARGRGRKVPRADLDTVGNNAALIRLYTGHGFDFLGAEDLEDVEGLPGHYADGPCLRFEIVLSAPRA